MSVLKNLVTARDRNNIESTKTDDINRDDKIINKEIKILCDIDIIIYNYYMECGNLHFYRLFLFRTLVIKYL